MECNPSATSATGAPPKSSVCACGPLGRWAMLLVALVAIGAAGVYWYWNHTANWGVVTPGKIYRSATISRHLVRGKLADNHIGVIVFLSRDTGDDPDLTAERAAATDLGVQFLNFPMNGDGVARPDQYPAALKAVHQAVLEGKPVLIHCHSGAQRTGGVVAMYRMLIEGKPMREAYAELTHYGFDPARNPALLPFLNEHMQEWARDLAAAHIISVVPQTLEKLKP